jgi:hypothetical protein
MQTSKYTVRLGRRLLPRRTRLVTQNEQPVPLRRRFHSDANKAARAEQAFVLSATGTLVAWLSNFSVH